MDLWDHFLSKKEGKDQESIQQAPHLTQDTNDKVPTSQLDIKNESQEVSPFPTGDHKAPIYGRERKHNKKDINNKNDPQKKHRLGTVSIFLLDDLNRFHGAPSSPLVQMWITAHRNNLIQDKTTP